jgi:enamine deaminase RidA (YjgF/YER057c/UK114 family)
MGPHERLNPESLSPPVGFSHAVRVPHGTLVFLAGQTALSSAGVIVGTGLVEQFRRALENLLTALGEAGGRPSDLTKLTVFVRDMRAYRADAREIGAVWRSLVGRDYPAMAVVGITELWDDEALVEVEGIAVVPSEPAS